MRRLFVVAACVAVLGAAGAFAGEVKGPSTGAANTNETGAPEHANSGCAYSGLNDYQGGQTQNPVQTAADAWNFYGYQPGDNGKLGLCRGGTNIPE